ncbi:MAG: hypothetical protein GY757_33540 [bacterium]|nr:hypothetical protein [bacterium]
MKTKKLSQKLILKKTTIVSLDDNKMRFVHGGDDVVSQNNYYCNNPFSVQHICFTEPQPDPMLSALRLYTACI